MKIIIVLLILAAIAFTIITVVKGRKKPKKIDSSLGQATYQSAIRQQVSQDLEVNRSNRSMARDDYSYIYEAPKPAAKAKSVKRNREDSTYVYTETNDPDWYSAPTYTYEAPNVDNSRTSSNDSGNSSSSSDSSPY